MTIVFKGETPGHIYREQLQALLTGGEAVTVRDRLTLELLNCVTEITNPRARIQIVPGRKINPWLALSECLWLLSGRNDVAALEPYNKRIREFSDDGKTLYGSYGYRLKDQIPGLIKRLKEDSTDRRAVLQIWRYYDLNMPTNDPPCNNMIHFKIRQNQLYMTVYCRSNDLHWGLHAVNLIQFSFLQEYLAERLNCQLGTQVHFSNSLHIYTDKIGATITNRMLSAEESYFAPMSPDWPLFMHSKKISHEEYVKAYSDVLDWQYEGDDPFLNFAQGFLQNYTDNEIIDSSMYPSWVAAGREFRK